VVKEIAKPGDIETAVGTTLKVFSRIDILGNNTGISPVL